MQTRVGGDRERSGRGPGGDGTKRRGGVGEAGEVVGDGSELGMGHGVKG